MSELGTIKWGKAASQEMHLGGVYVCRICNMFVEHGSDDCPHSNPPKPAVPPAMQRALGEGEYNTIGEELRKLAKINELTLDRLRVLSAQGSVNCEKIDKLVSDNNAAWLVVKERKESAARVEASLQLIMQKLEGLMRSKDALAIEARIASRLDGEIAVLNMRLRAIESVVRARKRQPKPVRRKGRK